MAAQYNVIIHQMDVKTVHLYTPTDQKIYIDQPEGFEVKWNADKKPVCILYGLKQSDRNWNKTPHDCLTRIDFIQNQVDRCIDI